MSDGDSIKQQLTALSTIDIHTSNELDVLLRQLNFCIRRKSFKYKLQSCCRIELVFLCLEQCLSAPKYSDIFNTDPVPFKRINNKCFVILFVRTG